MLLDADQRPPVPADPLEHGAEALIPEARRRTRRRRIRRLVAVAVLVGLGAAAYAVVGSGSAGVVAETGTRPFVNLRAFSGRGELAFVSRGRAWVLDGGSETVRRLPLPDGDEASSPVFSPDGRWLAYLVGGRHASYGPFRLWMARADGTAAHPVRGLLVDQFVGWSPSVDLVAVATEKPKRPVDDSPTTLDVVSPSGHSRALLTRLAQTPAGTTRGAIWSAVWSPRGRSLAVSTYSPDRDAGTQILDVPVAAGARPTVWFSIRNTQRLTVVGCGRLCGGNAAVAQLAGWWPKWGIGFWVFTSGMTHNNDSTPLAAITKPGARPRQVTQTLSDGTTDAVSAGPAGQLAVVASSEPAGREYADGKTVQQCSPATFSCTSLPAASTWAGRPLKCKPCFNAPATGPGSAVSLDPAWSPNGTLLAYVKAPAYRAAGGPRLAWFNAHQLYVWNSRTNVTRRIGAISGSSLPTWSHAGKSLLYVSHDGLWLADPTTGKATEIEHPLYRESAWEHIGSIGYSYYGQLPWSKQFNWYG